MSDVSDSADSTTSPEEIRLAEADALRPSNAVTDEPRLDEEVVDNSESDDETLYKMSESSLNYFGADFDVQGLVRRLDDEDIVIPRFSPNSSEGTSLAGFQRSRVWDKKKMEQFVESLLLGWPIPSIFLVEEPDHRHLVLDGQQRLTTLKYFLEGKYPDGKPFVLDNVAKHLKGATWETLERESKRRFRNTFIQAIVIQPVGDDGPDSVYRLFGRLNSGGVALTAQEIRVAMYLGPAVELIRDLNSNSAWRAMFGPPNLRLKDHELILRGLAMFELLAQNDRDSIDGVVNDQFAYRPPMSEFLNSYLKRHRDLSGINSEDVSRHFSRAVEVLHAALQRDGLRFNGRINAAYVDSVVSSLMLLSARSELPSSSSVTRSINALRDNREYAEFVTRSTSHRENVLGRLSTALTTLHSND